jgi:endonuclease/exonuclease/phosphatase family metal-dependent hydrolase
VAGDLNAWWPGAREVRILEHAVGPSPAPRTFPSKRPLFRLDRVFVRPPHAVVGWGVADDPRTRSASDHLPLWVDLEIIR